jgi:hypothetical protein
MPEYLKIAYPTVYTTDDPTVKMRIQRQTLVDQIKAQLEKSPSVLVQSTDLFMFAVSASSLVNLESIQQFMGPHKIQVKSLVKSFAFAYRPDHAVHTNGAAPEGNDLGPNVQVEPGRIDFDLTERGSELVEMLLPYYPGNTVGLVTPRDVLAGLLEEVDEIREILGPRAHRNETPKAALIRLIGELEVLRQHTGGIGQDKHVGIELATETTQG